MEKIKEIRQALGLSQAEFADRLKMTRTYVSLLEQGKRQASVRTLEQICDTFNVNGAWLMNGEGEMFLPKTRADEIRDLLYDIEAKEPQGEKLLRLIHILADLSPEKIESLYDVITKLSDIGEEDI